MTNNNNIETFLENNPFIFDEITDSNIGVSFEAESANTGDVVCITSLYDELIRRFGSYSNAKWIYEYARNSIVDGHYSDEMVTSIPYLDFTIYLEQTIIDEGLLSPYAEKWIPGKMYYSGDTVYYSVDGSDENMKTYILTSQQWSGYYDKNKTRLLYFDTLNNDGTLNLVHWKENITTNTGSYFYSGITGTTESILPNVMRRKTDMDISGNTLPFILHYNDIIQRGVKTGRELDSGSTETFYMCGNMNMNYDFAKQKVVSDVLESVTFYNSNSVPESGISFTEIDKPIIVTIDKNAYTDENDMKSIADCDMVQFVYYSSATLREGENGRWDREENTGVKYIENRPMIIQTSEFVIELDGDNCVELTLTYITINSNTQSETDYNNIDIINSLRSNINYSNITVNSSQLGDDYFLNSATFKDEVMMGVQNITKDINVNIERGIAESFQKHNMLGEICTLQDLENYKNGRYLK